MTLIQKRVVYVVVPDTTTSADISVHEEKTGSRGAAAAAKKWENAGLNVTILTRSVR